MLKRRSVGAQRGGCHQKRLKPFNQAARTHTHTHINGIFLGQPWESWFDHWCISVSLLDGLMLVHCAGLRSTWKHLTNCAQRRQSLHVQDCDHNNYSCSSFQHESCAFHVEFITFLFTLKILEKNKRRHVCNLFFFSSCCNHLVIAHFSC